MDGVETINDITTNDTENNILNKVERVSLAGGLIGALTTNPKRALNNMLELNNAQGWKATHIDRLMSKIKNPQEKKRLSYSKDRRNSYGESDKGSRKSIPKNKQLRSKAERSKESKLKQISSHGLDDDLLLEVENEVKSTTKLKRLQGFKKCPDQPLEKHIKQQKRKNVKRIEHNGVKNMPKNQYKGGCLCGRIRFEITGTIKDIIYCHCSQCRKAQGSAFAVNGNVSSDEFHFMSGENELTGYESSSDQTKYFCKHCGSPIFSKKKSTPDIVRIRLGALETDIIERPVGHIFVTSKANWEAIGDDLPQYDEYEPGVNVGGKNLLPMKDLKDHLEKAGFEQVKTYIQSGNIVLMSANDPENEIRTLIEENFGFAPKVMVLSVNEFNHFR
ncbi:Centromere protein V [Nymphon striatum]|nr:Centromere protein V [Nymphon striatum]